MSKLRDSGHASAPYTPVREKLPECNSLLYDPRIKSRCSMAICRVRFSEPSGVDHVADVEAKSVCEAVCRGWAAFMFAGGWDLFEASWKAHEFIVVAADSRTYRVDRDKFLEWLSKDRDSSARKKYLRRVLDGLAE